MRWCWNSWLGQSRLQLSDFFYWSLVLEALYLRSVAICNGAQSSFAATVAIIAWFAINLTSARFFEFSGTSYSHGGGARHGYVLPPGSTIYFLKKYARIIWRGGSAKPIAFFLALRFTYCAFFDHGTAIPHRFVGVGAPLIFGRPTSSWTRLVCHSFHGYNLRYWTQRWIKLTMVIAWLAMFTKQCTYL